MNQRKVIVIDTHAVPWEERFNEKIGRALFRKELFTDPETGVLIRLVRYPAGLINPKHTHPCGHGMYVLEGKLVDFFSCALFRRGYNFLCVVASYI